MSKLKILRRKICGVMFPKWCWQTYEIGICYTKIVVKNGWGYSEGSERQNHAMPHTNAAQDPVTVKLSQLHITTVATS